MKIVFNNVVPNPMKDERFSKESVWNSTREFNTSEKHFLQSGSGKGKSTFSAYIIGLRTDYTGTITINGEDQKSISLDKWSKLRRNHLAFLAQDMRLFPNLTVIENLLIKNELTNYKTETEIVTMLSHLEMDHKQNQLAGTLSLGQQQRVALIRALLQPFDLLLLDEPFSHIDEANIARAITLITAACDMQSSGFILTTLGYDYGITNAQTILL